MPRLIDCFIYNGESIVEYRLKTMFDWVDQIFITEARYSFTGVCKKELYIDKHAEMFKPYRAKIQFLVIENFPNTPSDFAESQPVWQQLNLNTWFREYYQRNYAVSSIKEYCVQMQQQQQHPDFIILVCDVDEIVHTQALCQLQKSVDFAYKSPIAYLEMDLYLYNWRWKQSQKWYSPFAIHFSYLFLIAEQRYQDLAHIREAIQTRSSSTTLTINHHYIPSSGYHLSYFMTPAEIVRKLESFSHCEQNKAEYKNAQYLSWCIGQGIEYSQNDDKKRSALLCDESLNTKPVLLLSRKYPQFGLCDDRWKFGAVAEPSSISNFDTQISELVLHIHKSMMKNAKNQLLVIDAIIPREHTNTCAQPISNVIDLDSTMNRLQSAFPNLQPVVLLDREDTTTNQMEVVEAWYGNKNEFGELMNVLNQFHWTSDKFLYIPSAVDFNHVFGKDPCPGKAKVLYLVLHFPFLQQKYDCHAQITLEFMERCALFPLRMSMTDVLGRALFNRRLDEMMHTNNNKKYNDDDDYTTDIELQSIRKCLCFL